MKTREEFKQFLHSTPEISVILKGVDKKRKANVNLFLLSCLISFIFIAVVFYSSFDSGDTHVEGRNNTTYLIIGGFLLLSVGYVIYYFLTSRAGKQPEGAYQDFVFDLKDKIIRRIITFWDPTFRYEINGYIPLPMITPSNMLVEDSYEVRGSDLIRGEHNEVSFRFCDLYIKRERLFAGRSDEEDNLVLYGSMFIADFNKNFRNPVYVYPKKNRMQNLQREGDEILLESAEFSKLFRVYSADEVEARYILTPLMMEHILKLVQNIGKSIHLVFANNRIYIANNNGCDRFEVTWYQSVNKEEKLMEFFNELHEQLSVIDILRLNLKIWK